MTSADTLIELVASNATGLRQPSVSFGRSHMKSLMVRFTREDQGQDLIEYALLAGFISLVAVVAITNVGTGVNAVYTNIDGQVKKIPAGTGS
jgi:pilus assembly protein Flp/PilA